MSDRDPVAEQEEAARLFEERMGRKSTDPAPPAILHMKLTPDGIEVEQTPAAVFGRFPGGTDPRAALHEVFDAMFPGATEVPASGYARKSKYPDAIEANVIEDDIESQWIPFCTCENVASWVPGTKFTICDNCNHPDVVARRNANPPLPG